MADLASVPALDFVVQAYISAAKERDDLELLHLLSTSPDSHPPSSDEFSEDDLEAFGGRVGPDERRRSSVPAEQPRGAAEGQAIDKAKDSKVVFAADPETAFVFEREEVVPLTEDPEATGTSALTAMLKDKDAGGQLGGGKQMQIRVFGEPIPGDPMDVLVPERATMAQVITLVLNQYMRESHLEMLYLEGVDFELLMAEDDGEPDEDMPKLNRNQIIGEFGHTHFALRKHNTPQAIEEAPEEPKKGGAKSSMLRVHLPPETHGQRVQNRSILVQAAAEMLLSELMQLVCRKPTVQLDPAKHVFRREVDAKDELDMCGAADLQANGSGQRSIVVAAKVYADAPRQQGARPGSRSVDQDKMEDAAKETDFIFSDVTAARYKEYTVVKVNKRGVRQERLLGIDRDRFYNIAARSRPAATAPWTWPPLLSWPPLLQTTCAHLHAPLMPCSAPRVAQRSINPEESGSGGGSTLREWGLKTVGLRSASGGTKHPFHLVRDIMSVSLGQEQPTSFFCVFKDPLGEERRKEYHYEAASQMEAAEIVAKINHLIQLHTKGRESRLVHTTPRRESARRGHRRGSEMGGEFTLRSAPSTMI